MAPQLWPLGVHKHLMGDKCQRGLRGGPEVGCALGTPGNAFLAGAQGTRELQWLQAGRQPPRPHIATGRGLTWTISPHFTERPPSLLTSTFRHSYLDTRLFCKSFLSGFDCLERKTGFCFFAVGLWQCRAQAFPKREREREDWGQASTPDTGLAPWRGGLILPAVHFQAFCKLES